MGLLRRFRNMSLCQKLVFWSFAPTAIILVVVVLVAFSAYQQVIEDLAIERDRDLTRLLADQLGIELQHSIELLQNLTRKPDLYEGDVDRQASALRRADSVAEVFDAGLVILDVTGQIIWAEPTQTRSLSEDWGQRDWHKATRPTFSDVIAEGPDGSAVAALTVPILDARDRLVGVLVGVFHVRPSPASSLHGGIRRGIRYKAVLTEDPLYVDDSGRLRPRGSVSALARLFQHQQLVSIQRKSTGRAYVVDSRGQAIYHSDPARIGQDMSDTLVVQTALQGRVGAVRMRDADGRQVVASYAPVPLTPWRLITEESWEELTAFSRGYRGFLLALLALGVALPAVIVSAAMRRITDPIGQMIRAARDVAAGRFGHRIQANTGDELENLAEQFNTMSRQLEASYADLERRVADRTRELATLNAIAAVTSQSLDLEDVLEAALNQTLQAIDFDTGEAVSVDPDTHVWGPVARHGFDQPLLQRSAWPVPPLIGAEDADSGTKPVALPVRDMADGELKLALQRQGLQVIVRVPLVAKNRTVGTMDLASNRLRRLTDDELTLLAAIGQQVGVAVDNAQLHDKAQRLAVVEERNRLARELHDSVTQSLYAIQFYAEASARLLAADDATPATDHLRQLGETARAALQEMRLLVFDLRPPLLRQEGMVAALQARLDAVEGRAGLATRLQVRGQGLLSAACEEALYSIAREALNNILKHSHATTVAVSLEYQDDTAALRITDDGVGFDVDEAGGRGGMGLRGMMERGAQVGARFSIISEPGHGTTISVEVGCE